MEPEAPGRDEGDVSALVAFLIAATALPLALLVAAWAAVPSSIIGMSLGSWHASRGERPVLSSLAVPLALAGLVAAGWAAVT